MNKNTPGYICLIGKENKIIYEKLVGLSDYKKKIPISYQTSFRCASLSKQFTAMAIMMLEERGMLKYGDTLSKYFTDYPNYGKQVTINRLLCHCAGVPDHEKLLYKNIKRGQEPTIYDALEILKKQNKPLFKPGIKYQYSDAGYVLLAIIIEKVSGMKYGDFLQDNIFKTLKMDNTTVLDERKPFISNRAFGYRYKNKKWNLYDYDVLNYIIGDEGVYSTARDLFKWRKAWLSEILVSKKTLKKALTIEKFKNGDKSKCGYSWFIQEIDGRKWIFHTGTWVGFNNIMVNVLAEDLTLIILSNTNEFLSLKKKIDIAKQQLAVYL